MVDIDMLKCNLSMLADLPPTTLIALSYAVEALGVIGVSSDIDTIMNFVVDTDGLKLTKFTFNRALIEGINCGLLAISPSNLYSVNGKIQSYVSINQPMGV